MTTKNKKGFTIIEVVLVLALLAKKLCQLCSVANATLSARMIFLVS